MRQLSRAVLSLCICAALAGCASSRFDLPSDHPGRVDAPEGAAHARSDVLTAEPATPADAPESADAPAHDHGHHDHGAARSGE